MTTIAISLALLIVAVIVLGARLACTMSDCKSLAESNTMLREQNEQLTDRLALLARCHLPYYENYDIVHHPTEGRYSVIRNMEGRRFGSSVKIKAVAEVKSFCYDKDVESQMFAKREAEELIEILKRDVI